VLSKKTDMILYMMSINDELIIFIDKALSKVAELPSRLVSPPIYQVSILVVLAA